MTVSKDGDLTGTFLCLTEYCFFFFTEEYGRGATEKQSEIPPRSNSE